MTLEQLSWFVDDVVARELQGLKGVGRVDRYGGVDREIQVSLDPDRLMALGVTAGDVNRQLRATNVDLAGGRGEFGGQEQAIRTLAGARTVVGSRRDQDHRCRAAARCACTISAVSTDSACGAALLRPARQAAGRRLRRLPLQGRQRAVGQADVVEARIAELNKRYPGRR